MCTYVAVAIVLRMKPHLMEVGRVAWTLRVVYVRTLHVCILVWARCMFSCLHKWLQWLQWGVTFLNAFYQLSDYFNVWTCTSSGPATLQSSSDAGTSKSIFCLTLCTLYE
jgi:hypothetical protein